MTGNTTPQPDRRATPRHPQPGSATSSLHGAEYITVPAPRVPLCVPLPSDWYDDPGFVLHPFATAGTLSPAEHVGVLGRMVRGGEKIAVCYDRPFVHCYFGPPGYGKTYGDGCHVENVLIRSPYLNRRVRPYCAISLHYEYGRSHDPEILASRAPNSTPGEVDRLVHDYGSLPQGIPDGICFTLEDHVRDHRERFPHWQIHALKFATWTLGIIGLKLLMGFDEDDDTFYGAQFEDLLRALPARFTAEEIEEALEDYPFQNEYVRTTLKARFLMARPFLDDRYPSLRSYIRAQRLICVDIRDGWLSPQKAMRVFAALNFVLFMSGDRDELPCDLLLCMDETHKFTRHPVVARQIEYVVREHRHLRVSLILSSQDPMSVPRSVLAQMDLAGIYRTDAQRWLDCLAQEIQSFRRVSVEEFLGLFPGQMVLWARQWSETSGLAELRNSPLLLLDVRPRLSQHGGPASR